LEVVGKAFLKQEGGKALEKVIESPKVKDILKKFKF
jgi:hypothetical protein